MEQMLNILLLEDRKSDAELVKRAILKENTNVAFTHASNEAQFLERLGWASYDIMLADYNIPGYNGLDALLHIKAIDPDLPFIFVTGMLDSEMEAAQSILNGANGYVLKDNLSALYPQIKLALEKTVAKKEERQARAQEAHDHAMKIQKAIALLEKGNDFPEKTEAINLLNSIELSTSEAS